jgi:hypothetical protein
MGWAITVLPPLGSVVRRRAREGLDQFIAEGGSPPISS